MTAVTVVSILAVISTSLSAACLVGFMAMTIFVQYYIGWHHGLRSHYMVAHIVVSGAAVFFAAVSFVFWLVRLRLLQRRPVITYIEVADAVNDA